MNQVCLCPFLALHQTARRNLLTRLGLLQASMSWPFVTISKPFRCQYSVKARARQSLGIKMKVMKGDKFVTVSLEVNSSVTVTSFLLHLPNSSPSSNFEQSEFKSDPFVVPSKVEVAMLIYGYRLLLLLRFSLKGSVVSSFQHFIVYL